MTLGFFYECPNGKFTDCITAYDLTRVGDASQFCPCHDRWSREDQSNRCFPKQCTSE